MSKLQSQVIEFHKLFGQAIEPVPTIPSRKTVALRVMLVLEEALELFEACYGTMPETMIVTEMIKNVTIVREPRVNLAEVADALGDLDYVSEGSRLAFGIDGESVADAIHKSNCEKVGGKLRTDGKQGKPSNWSPPDIEGVLFKQNSGELPSVGDRLKNLEVMKAMELEEGSPFEGPWSESELWGVWVTSTCDRDSDDDWIHKGLLALGPQDNVPWTGTEAEARAYAEGLSKEPGRSRYGHEARKYVP